MKETHESVVILVLITVGNRLESANSDENGGPHRIKGTLLKVAIEEADTIP